MIGEDKTPYNPLLEEKYLGLDGEESEAKNRSYYLWKRTGNVNRSRKASSGGELEPFNENKKNACHMKCLMS